MPLNFSKLSGLVPAVVQNADTGAVLMLGFMNEDAYRKTLKTKRVWFYSRTKKRLWMKGEASGNDLTVVSVLTDCDLDSLLIKARPAGATCHTGAASCFGDAGDTLCELSAVIQSRQKERPEGSYTASLFNAGLPQICAKVKEESGEVIRAAQRESKQRVIEESADVLYHLFVLMAARGTGLDEVIEELRSRQR